MAIDEKIDSSWRLIGFLDAMQAPAFLIPVFQHGEENPFIQSISTDGLISGFTLLPDDVSVKALRNYSREIEAEFRDKKLDVGSDALFGFSPSEEEVWVASRERLSSRLIGWFAQASVSPILSLEILEFCSAPAEEIRSAIVASTQWLSERGVSQASHWKDYQLDRYKQFPSPGDERKLEESINELLEAKSVSETSKKFIAFEKTFGAYTFGSFSRRFGSEGAVWGEKSREIPRTIRDKVAEIMATNLRSAWPLPLVLKIGENVDASYDLYVKTFAYKGHMHLGLHVLCPNSALMSPSIGATPVKQVKIPAMEFAAFAQLFSQGAPSARL